jgi:hypothetical protein
LKVAHLQTRSSSMAELLELASNLSLGSAFCTYFLIVQL